MSLMTPNPSSDQQSSVCSHFQFLTPICLFNYLQILTDGFGILHLGPSSLAWPFPTIGLVFALPSIWGPDGSHTFWSFPSQASWFEAFNHRYTINKCHFSFQFCSHNLKLKSEKEYFDVDCLNIKGNHFNITKTVKKKDNLAKKYRQEYN